MDRQTYVQEALERGYSAEAAEKIADERLDFDALIASGVKEDEAAELVWGPEKKAAEPTPSAPSTPAPAATPDPATPGADDEIEPEGELVLDASVNLLVPDPKSETGFTMAVYRHGTPVKDTQLSAEQIDELTAQRHIVLRPTKSSGAK
jgi:hypothetical protein